MATLLSPYLNFSDNAREAMETYQRIFGGNLDVNTFGEFGDTGPAADKVMHSQLTADDGFTLMASDTPPQMESWGNGAISLFGEDHDRLSGYFDALAEGGQVQMPLEKQVWGDVYGQCVDRFGITWMVNISQTTSE